jgi:hypothetical protein
MENYTTYLASKSLHDYYSLPFEEQFKEVLHVRKVSEGLFKFVTGETALTTGMKKHEHSVELQFESKKLVVVLRDGFFEEEYLHNKDNSDLLLVTLEEMVVDAAIEKGIVMKYVSVSAFKELVEKNVGEYMKVLVEAWDKSGEEIINE